MGEPKIPQMNTNNAEDVIPKKEEISAEQIENIKEVFKLNPEIEKVGNIEEYAKYIETIFPESKVKSILFHATRAEFENFKDEYVSKGNVSFGDGFYFSDHLDTHSGFKGADKMKSVVVNMQKVFYDSKDAKDHRELPKYNPEVNSHEKLLEVQEKHQKYLKDNFDGVIAEYRGKNEFVVLSEKNIHILGAEQDIENFKKWIESQKNEEK